MWTCSIYALKVYLHIFVIKIFLKICFQSIVMILPFQKCITFLCCPAFLIWPVLAIAFVMDQYAQF